MFQVGTLGLGEVQCLSPGQLEEGAKPGVDGPKAFHSLDFPASITSLAKLTLATDLIPPTNVLLQ